MTLGELILESTSKKIIESVIEEKTGSKDVKRKKKLAKRRKASSNQSKALAKSNNNVPSKSYKISYVSKSGGSNVSAPKPQHIDRNRKHQKSGAAKHAGRKRLISAVATMAAERSGTNVSKDQVRSYLSELDKRMREDKEPSWLRKIVAKAKSLGFDPYHYIDQSKGASSGVSNHGEPEYKGRAYFFVALANNVAKDLRDGFTKPQQRSYTKRGK